MNGQIYMAWTSHCDQDPYTGWLMAYSESTLQQTGVFNMTPNGPSSPHFANGEGSVWMSGAGLGADTQGNIFFLDANGSFDTTLDGNGFPARGDFGNSFLKISTSANKLAAADYFAVYNTQAESAADQDLGSGGAMLLPDLVDAGGATRHLAVGAGKDTNIYVVDRDNMGKFNPGSNNSLFTRKCPMALSGGVFSCTSVFQQHGVLRGGWRSSEGVPGGASAAGNEPGSTIREYVCFSRSYSQHQLEWGPERHCVGN